MKRIFQGEDRYWISFLLIGLGLGLALRIYLASFAEMPGHGDSAFYYTVAKNIANGRGPVVDYIVYFFSGLLPLPHYAGDFWNPTASYLISIPMILFGSSISTALIAPIAAGLIPAWAAFLACRDYSQSLPAAVAAGLLTFFSPFQVWFSVTTEAIVFSGAFGSLALYFMIKGRADPRSFLAAAIFTGLAHLIRQDNVLLLLTLVACIFLSPSLSFRNKTHLVTWALAFHFLILSPVLIRNYQEFQLPFPPGPAKTAFLTTYEDFHSYNKEIDWDTLRATLGIRGILKKRWHTAIENLGQLDYFIDSTVAVIFLLSVCGTVIARGNRARLPSLLPPLIFLLLAYSFYSLVASYSGPGSLIKSLGALMPFICIVIADFMVNNLRHKLLLVSWIVLLCAYMGYQGFEKNYASTLYYNDMYQKYKLVGSTIAADAAERGENPQEITILARDTWDVYEGTGFKTVMVPNNDLETILFVARHYRAHYILLPADRPALNKIYLNTTPDPRFTFLDGVPGTDMRIYRLEPGPP